MTTMMMGRQDDSLIKIIKLPGTTRHTKGFGGDAIYTKTGVVLPSPIPKSDHSLAKQSANPYEMNSTLNCFPSSHPFARIMMTVYLAEEDSPLSHHFSLSPSWPHFPSNISPIRLCILFCPFTAMILLNIVCAETPDFIINPWSTVLDYSPTRWMSTVFGSPHHICGPTLTTAVSIFGRRGIRIISHS